MPTETAINTTGVLFENDGEIDMNLVRLMGVSVKESDNPIGYFGTGLKYAIAVLMRDHCQITIMSGINEYRFDTKVKNLRGKDFRIITMNDEELGFTTELGKKWDMWCAYREIYCNMTDEGGSWHQVQGESIYPQAGKTKIVVTGYKFMDIHNNRNDYILSSEPLAVVPGLEIHPGTSRNIFYKGIRAYTFENPCLYTYNITKTIDLSEDRQIKWWIDIIQILGQGFAQLNDAAIIETVVNPDNMILCPERHLTWAGITVISTKFKEVVKRRTSQNPDTVTPEVQKLMGFNRATHAQAPDNTYSDPDHEIMLQKALDIVTDAGYAPGATVRMVRFLGPGIGGAVIDGQIYITKEAFDYGLGRVVKVLIEEQAHLRYGYKDESRSFQNYLLNELATQIMKGK